MKKAIGLIVILILQFNIIFAQNSLEMGTVYSLTAEKLVNVEHMNSQLNHSFGINGKKIFQSNLFIQSGVYLRNFGTRSPVQAPFEIIDDYPTEIGGQSIDIPIHVGYYFLNNRKIRMGVSLGINNGFLLSQYHDYYGIIIETIPLYNDYLLSLNSSVEIGLRLTDNIILDIKPIFQRQINSNYGDAKQRGIGGQFGVSYAFKN